ncbi:PA1571 family protein [Acinetobacter larvae]|uniref:PA1571 family protein n=1 Tax=Acinetobacter larvae TaxID=1789224 RepID=UPI00267FB06C
MQLSDKITTRSIQHFTQSPRKNNTCVMLDDNGQETHITKAMVVSICQQLLKQCRNIKS